MRSVMVISQNALFKEVIGESLRACHEIETTYVRPQDIWQVLADPPEILLIDDSIPETRMGELFQFIRGRAAIQAFILSCEGNNVVVLEKHTETLGSARDLAQLIGT